MIDILETPDHLVGMKISGDMIGEDIEKASAALDKAIADNERVSIFVEVDPSMSLTIEGVVKDFIDGISRLGQMRRIYRAALVTDKGWMAAIARIEGLVFSSIDVRVFSPEDREKALAWASEAPEPLPKPEEPTASIHVIHTTNENVFAWEVDGRIREKDIREAFDAFEPFLKKDGKLNALVRMRNYSGFDLSAVLDDRLLRVKYAALSKIERYALVGAKPWMRNLAELFGAVIGPEVRVFDESEEDEAWEWVGARQALLPE